MAFSSTISTAAAFSGWSWENVVVPRTAAATHRPLTSVPCQAPWLTFQANTAWLPVMKTSEFEMQGPVKTSAVRAST